MTGDTPDRVHGLPPVWRPDARVLVLGSMPSVQSIARQEYYGHPRNAFWRIAGAVFGFDAELPYDARKAALRDARVALWDVCGSCERPGSADADIREVQANPIRELVAKSPALRVIALNGGKACELFAREIERPSGRFEGIVTLRLPSTSPAYASVHERQKLVAWRVLLDWLPERT